MHTDGAGEASGALRDVAWHGLLAVTCCFLTLSLLVMPVSVCAFVFWSNERSWVRVYDCTLLPVPTPMSTQHVR